MKSTHKLILALALIGSIAALSFTNKTESQRYEYLMVEYNDYSNDLTMSTTAGGFSKRNVKNLLLDRDNDRTPFLSEIKTQESNGWEAFQYSNTSRNSANFYSVIMRKPMN
jgi:hypothetical protein